MPGIKKIVRVSLSVRLTLISSSSYLVVSRFSAFSLAASFFFCSSSSDVSSRLDVPLCCDSVRSFGLCDVTFDSFCSVLPSTIQIKEKFGTFCVAVATCGGGLFGFSIDEQWLRNNIYFDSERIDPKVILFDVPAVRSGATSSVALCAGMAYQESVTKTNLPLPVPDCCFEMPPASPRAVGPPTRPAFL